MAESLGRERQAEPESTPASARAVRDLVDALRFLLEDEVHVTPASGKTDAVTIDAISAVDGDELHLLDDILTRIPGETFGENGTGSYSDLFETVKIDANKAPDDRQAHDLSKE